MTFLMSWYFIFRPSPVVSVKEIKVTKHPEKEDKKYSENWNFACFHIQPICLSWSAERDYIVWKAKEKKEYPTKKNKQDHWKKTKIKIKRKKHEAWNQAKVLHSLLSSFGLLWDTKKERLHIYCSNNGNK